MPRGAFRPQGPRGRTASAACMDRTIGPAHPAPRRPPTAGPGTAAIARSSFPAVSGVGTAVAKRPVETGFPTPTNPEIHTIMSKLNSLEDLFVHELKDLHSAESQLLKALPKFAEAATNESLRAAFEEHLSETEEHLTRIEQIMQNFEGSPRGKACKAMQGLIEEGEEIINEDAEPAVKDAALIVAAQKVEHYEISAYGSARAMAEALGQDDVADILGTTLDEESMTDEALTALAQEINMEAFEGAAADWQ